SLQRSQPVLDLLLTREHPLELRLQARLVRRVGDMLDAIPEELLAGVQDDQAREQGRRLLRQRDRLPLHGGLLSLELVPLRCELRLLTGEGRALLLQRSLLRLQLVALLGQRGLLSLELVALLGQLGLLGLELALLLLELLLLLLQLLLLLGQLLLVLLELL